MVEKVAGKTGGTFRISSLRWCVWEGGRQTGGNFRISSLRWHGWEGGRQTGWNIKMSQNSDYEWMSWAFAAIFWVETKGMTNSVMLLSKL
jgi:hypothetical protein